MEIEIVVAGFEEACDILSAAECNVDFLVSIGDFGDPLPRGFDNVIEKVRLNFADSSDGFGPGERDVETIIEFAGGIRARGGKVLIHCLAGVSRSTAAAFIIHCVLLGPGWEGEALRRVFRQRPIAIPNRRMVRLADGILGRGGAMLDALDNVSWSAVRPPGDESS